MEATKPEQTLHHLETVKILQGAVAISKAETELELPSPEQLQALLSGSLEELDLEILLAGEIAAKAEADCLLFEHLRRSLRYEIITDLRRGYVIREEKITEKALETEAYIRPEYLSLLQLHHRAQERKGLGLVKASVLTSVRERKMIAL